MLKLPNCLKEKWILSTTLSLRLTEKSFRIMPLLPNQLMLHTNRQCYMRGIVHNHGYTCALLLEIRKIPQPVSIWRVLSPIPPVWYVSYQLKHSCCYLYLLTWSASRGTWLRGKESKAQRPRWPPVNEEQMDLADQYLVLQLGLTTRIWLL